MLQVGYRLVPDIRTDRRLGKWDVHSEGGIFTIIHFAHPGNNTGWVSVMYVQYTNTTSRDVPDMPDPQIRKFIEGIPENQRKELLVQPLSTLREFWHSDDSGLVRDVPKDCEEAMTPKQQPKSPQNWSPALKRAWEIHRAKKAKMDRESARAQRKKDFSTPPIDQEEEECLYEGLLTFTRKEL